MAEGMPNDNGDSWRSSYQTVRVSIPVSSANHRCSERLPLSVGANSWLGPGHKAARYCIQILWQMIDRV